MEILELLKQRRIWAGIVFVLTMGLSLLSVNFNIDVPVLTDLLTAWGKAFAGLIMASLALWSYLKPK